jgi:transposase
MKTATEEIRSLVVKAYTSGTATRKQLAEIFGYHIQSIGNWIREHQRDGRLAPRPKGHKTVNLICYRQTSGPGLPLSRKTGILSA